MSFCSECGERLTQREIESKSGKCECCFSAAICHYLYGTLGWSREKLAKYNEDWSEAYDRHKVEGRI